MIKPTPATFDELADLLEELAARVRARDSFEGHLEWHIPDDGPLPDGTIPETDGADVHIVGGWRVGNAAYGQGGMQFTGPILEVPSRYRIVMFGRGGPDPDELDAAVREISVGTVHIGQPDTRSSDRALIVSTRPLNPADATEVYDLWWRNLQDEEDPS